MQAARSMLLAAFRQSGQSEGLRWPAEASCTKEKGEVKEVTEGTRQADNGLVYNQAHHGTVQHSTSR